ncbi:MAG: hypothetical protein ACK4HG_10005 [Agrobacterium albertimagni]
MTRDNASKATNPIRPHRVEWLTGLAATTIVVAMIGWMVFEALTSDDRPPELAVQILAIDPQPSGWRVMIEVRNSGDQAAAALDIKASLLDGPELVEEAGMTFDYVAAGSTSRGGLLFVNNPSLHQLQVVPSGFTEP